MQALHNLWPLITNIGNNGLLIVLSLVTAAYLMAVKERRAAVLVLACLVIIAGCITVLKIIFFGCSLRVPLEIHSPSGHAAMITGIMGTLAAILGGANRGWKRWIPLGLATPVIIMVSLSRVILEYHTLQEVLLGMAVGGITAAAAFCVLWRKDPLNIKPATLLLVLAVAAAASYGIHVPAEDLIQRLASLLEIKESFCKTLLML